jgi:vacuolar-type H+-ATPase subunit E/Vma4
MSENTLIQKITADADTQVEVVQKQAEAEVAVIVRETKSKVATLQSDAAAQLEKKKQQRELVATSRAKQASNIAVQNAKRTQIDAIFQQVFADLVGQSAEEYVSFFTTQAAAVIPKDVTITKIQAPAARLEETSKILATLNISAEVVTTSQVSAGLIAFAQDGVYDASFDRLFAEKRAELEMVIVNELVS